MEAMSAGLPVVASNIRGNTDLVDIKYSGFLCQSDSVEEFCEAIDHCLMWQNSVISVMISTIRMMRAAWHGMIRR